MKSGFKSSEFTLIGAVVAFASFMVFGSEDLPTGAVLTTRATEALPMMIGVVEKLADKYAPLAGLSGLAWAYLKRRSALKIRETKE